MYLCYVDESGTPERPGNTSHFVLAGLSIPIGMWRSCDEEIAQLKARYRLENTEIHVAWILRPYLEQTKIQDFESLSYSARIEAVQKYRIEEIYRLRRTKKPQLLKQTKKNFEKTTPYIHLTYIQRRQLIIDIATCISNWKFARLFAECVDKLHFDPIKTGKSIDEQSFEQLVSRFQQYLQNTQRSDEPHYGLLIHDNNPTVARKHTDLMKKYHQQGTLWAEIKNIVETPLW